MVKTCRRDTGTLPILFSLTFADEKYWWGVVTQLESLDSLQRSALRHWFTSVFLGFETSEQLLFDQHLLSALVAPQGLILTSGYEDYHTNPEGMFEACLEASKIS